MSGGRPGLPIPASWRQWPLTPLRGAITSRFTTSHKFSVRPSDSDLPFSLSATLLMELPLFSLSLECVTYCILSLYSPSPPVGSFAEGERRVFLDCGILRGAACSLASSFSAPSSAPASSFLLFPRSTFGCCVARMWGGERERERSGGKGWSGIPRGRCPCLLKTREEEEEEERKRRGEGNRRQSTGVPRLISKFRSGLTFKHGVGSIPAVLLVQLASAAQATLSRSLRLQSFNYACTVE